MKYLIFLLILTTFPAYAGVYKWVDANGKTHYGDHPKANQAQQVTIKAPPPIDPNMEKRRHLQQRVSDAMQTERLQLENERKKKSAQLAQRKAKCQLAKKRLQKYKEASYLYHKDKQTGEQQIFSQKERKVAVKNSQEAIKYWCQ